MPSLDKKDIIVNLRDAVRYEVLNVNDSKLQGETTSISSVLAEVSKSSPIYDINVDRWHNPGWF